MLHGIVAKLVIWGIVLSGLAPVALIALMAVAMTSVRPEPDRFDAEARAVLRSNHYLHVGPIRLQPWYPRAWAGVVLAIGASLIVVALVFLLHVP